jgi:pyruvate dehydrogenase E2 component (dihydrolipoyllysine-residue acetyltransferase)
MPDVVMPRLSDTMTEGVLSRWVKKEGDTVKKGDILAEIETDKAVMELEVYDAGVLERLLVAEGTEVPIGQPIAVIGDGSQRNGAAAPDPQDAGAGAASPPAEAEPTVSAPVQAVSTSVASAPASTSASSHVRSSPLARRIAHEQHIDLAELARTHPGQRIVSADVKVAVEERDKPTAAQSLPTTTAAPLGAAGASDRGADSEEIPLSMMRRATARRLTESAGAPHFFLTNVVNIERLMSFRAEVNQRYAERNIKVSVTDLLVRACAVTLREHPKINASWAQDKILQHRRIHVGVAVALEDGLIVPVVTDADTKGLDVIAGQTRALAERARASRLTPDEFSGGTFTISNLGMFGIDNFTAVINPPEAAILAVGAASEEPYVSERQLLSRRIFKMTLTVDHRVLDGATAAAFLRDLKRTLEEPLRMVL